MAVLGIDVRDTNRHHGEIAAMFEHRHVLNPALSLMPITRITVMIAVMEYRRQVCCAAGPAPVRQAGNDAAVVLPPVYRVVIPGRRGESWVETNMEHVAQKGVEMVGPTRGDDARSNRILEYQVPANDPRNDLTQRRVRIRCKPPPATGTLARELGIAKRSKAAADGRQQKREHQRRAGRIPGNSANQHVQPGADCMPTPRPVRASGPSRRLRRARSNSSRESIAGRSSAGTGSTISISSHASSGHCS